MPWFKVWRIQRNGEYVRGRTIWEALNVVILPEQPIKKPLRLPLQDVYKIGGIGTVPFGRVATGILKPNMIVKFSPSNLSSKVKSIETSPVFDGRISVLFIDIIFIILQELYLVITLVLM
jgi:elongation factor 1-alpha